MPRCAFAVARCERLSRDEVDAWLAQQDGGGAPSIAGVAHVEKSVSRDAFDAAIAAVHDALRAGDSYQVNYTYRLNFDVFGTPLALYRRLRARQPVRYGALIALPDGPWVVSCSPELFVEKHGDVLRARPMKGTAPRSANPRDDAAAATFLANDPKNRAENVMIVDLLRNDVSRIARTGTVRVPALFSVEPYASVWQMTSTVEAGWRDGTTFAQMLRALFPCGSITGAPKHKTMELIDAIESTPRGFYTGAIGWLDAAKQRADSDAPGDRLAGCGDFCLSVAIRTLTLDAASEGADCEGATDAEARHPATVIAGRRRGTMGVGAGIVLDSVAADEYAECELKARFLTDADPGFQLFETTAATRADGIRHLDRHLARLQRSADAFGFRFDADALRREIDARCAALDGDGAYRMKLALAKDGTIEIVAAPLAAAGGAGRCAAGARARLRADPCGRCAAAAQDHTPRRIRSRVAGGGGARRLRHAVRQRARRGDGRRALEPVREARWPVGDAAARVRRAAGRDAWRAARRSCVRRDGAGRDSRRSRACGGAAADQQLRGALDAVLK